MNAGHIANNFDVLTALWALGGASIVAAAAQLLKKFFKLDSAKVIQFLVVSLGFAVAGLQYLLGAHNIPPTVLGLHTVALVGIAQPLYIYVVKPLDSFFTKVQTYNAGLPANAAPANGSGSSVQSGNSVTENTPQADF